MIHITFGQRIKPETFFSIPILILATLPICNFIEITPENPVLWTGMKDVYAKGGQKLMRC